VLGLPQSQASQLPHLDCVSGWKWAVGDESAGATFLQAKKKTLNFKVFF
jgi:hypothetical protein